MRRILLVSSLCLVAGSGAQAAPRQGQPSAPEPGQPIVTTQAKAESVPSDKAPAPVKTEVTVAGKVTLPGGRSAGNVALYLAWQSADGRIQFHKFLADSEGAFHTTANLAPAPANSALGITVIAPGVGFTWHTVDSASPTLERLHLTLRPLKTISGRMVLADGRPAVHAPVMATYVRSMVQGENGSSNFRTGPAGARVLPDEEARTAWNGRTDAAGRFTLKNIPTGCEVALAAGGDLALTRASSVPFESQEDNATNLGVLVATRTSSLQVHVVDAATGRPAAGAQVLIRRQNGADNVLPADASGQFPAAKQIVLDDKGIGRVTGLLPGDYEASLQDQRKSVHVPGAGASLLEMRVRRGSLRGRLLDASGKPLAKVAVTFQYPFDPIPQAPGGGFSGEFAGPGNNLIILPGVQQPGLASTMITNTEGEFEVPDFRWGAPSIRLRAVQGSALAEWTGLPATIGNTLTLKMRPDALITVTGRLIDPQRRPLGNATCETLHWLPSPRRSWFATAQPVKVDAQGRFQVCGLERGESFSIITMSSSRELDRKVRSVKVSFGDGVFGDIVTEGGGQMLGGDLAVRGPGLGFSPDFESPRFVTRLDAAEQDLGDTMVHPNQNSEENRQIYGAAVPQVLARLPGFLDTPNDDSTAQAKRVLAQYQKAIEAGDVDTAYRLSSRLSFGWSPTRSEYLLHGWLRATGNMASAYPTRAIPLVSRFSAATLISFDAAADGAQRDFDAAERALRKHPDWVFLARNDGRRVALAGILRKEDGQWRVVTVPDSLLQIVEAAVLQIGGDSPADFARIIDAPSADERESAVQAGKQFLQDWASKGAAMFGGQGVALSIASASRVKETGFVAALPQRADDGVCPIDRDEQVALHPISSLSLWDLERLVSLVQSQTGNRLPALSLIPKDRIGVPAKGTIAPEKVTTFEYENATGRRFLMLVAKNDSGWHVLEPALPR